LVLQPGLDQGLNRKKKKKTKNYVTATVTISALLFLQSLGIAGLNWLMYRGPFETTSLDAITVSRLMTNLKLEKEMDGQHSAAQGEVSGDREANSR
jgi:hypothetical protein